MYEHMNMLICYSFLYLNVANCLHDPFWSKNPQSLQWLKSPTSGKRLEISGAFCGQPSLPTTTTCPEASTSRGARKAGGAWGAWCGTGLWAFAVDWPWRFGTAKPKTTTWTNGWTTRCLCRERCVATAVWCFRSFSFIISGSSGRSSLRQESEGIDFMKPFETVPRDEKVYKPSMLRFFLIKLFDLWKSGKSPGICWPSKLAISALQWSVTRTLLIPAGPGGSSWVQ